MSNLKMKFSGLSEEEKRKIVELRRQKLSPTLEKKTRTIADANRV